MSILTLLFGQRAPAPVHFEYVRPYTLAEITSQVERIKIGNLPSGPILSGWVGNLEYVFTKINDKYYFLGSGYSSNGTSAK